MRKLTLGLCCALLLPGIALAQIDGSTYEAEDFEITEEDMKFDHARTGLLYRRNLYVEGDNITFLSQQPTSYNDTRDMRSWMVYVSHWEEDPPSFINVFIRDDSPYHYSSGTIDMKVMIGHYDRARNIVNANEVTRRNIPIVNGINRIPVNIHNYPGDIVSVRLIAVKQNIPYHPIDVTD